MYTLRNKLKKISDTIKVFSRPELIPLYWYYKNSGQKNWGDALNPILVKYISGKDVIHARSLVLSLCKPLDICIYTAIGSILDNLSIPNTIVWGSGFLDTKSKVYKAPKRVCTVRGKLTRSKLLSMGIKCPELYGDPALLIPKYFNPLCNKKHELGIVPHYIDYMSPLLSKFRHEPRVNIIDITKGIEKVVQEIKSCKLVASSSLHGIIAADAYGIPSLWIKLSDKILGDDFKYYDYFSSVGRNDTNPLIISSSTSYEQIVNNFQDYKIDIDLDKVYDACPFRK